MREELVFKVLEILVMIASIIITRYAVPWLKEKTQNERFQEVEAWIFYAVRWAEQVHDTASGETRKQLVYKFLRRLLDENNITFLDEDQLNALIEAAVRAMNTEMGKHLD